MPNFINDPVLVRVPNQSVVAIRIENAINLTHITGMLQTNDGFFHITNRINNPNGFARLDSGGRWTIVSDLKAKKDVETASNLLEKALSLNPVNFYYKNQNLEQLPHKLTGFIAQEVEEIFPQFVVGTDTKSVDYNGLVSVAIGAIKEMKQHYDKKIANLEMQLEQLKKDIRTVEK
ncbi:tail fiber domain-containing protein [[Scytonema hofmanni] UTEX B 1581]|nr:tail fiber domain-containing protein [[Scytonema hofmanni] UTEX B 1581]